MRHKVLYVEDDPQLHALVKAMLNMTDYVMIPAEDGESGLQAALEHQPDIILMDINLPGGSGTDVVLQLKQIPSLANIPVIAMTADDSRDNRERCFAVGCANVLFKPVSRFVLLDTLRKYTNTQKATSELASFVSTPTHTRKKVLVVDDNEDLRFIFGRAFDRHHFEVLEVGDGESALGYMEENLPDVVILDVNMPGLSGFDVLSVIRNDERLKLTKVIVVTGNTLAPNDPQAELADLLLLKPVDITELFNFAKRMMVP